MINISISINNTNTSIWKKKKKKKLVSSINHSIQLSISSNSSSISSPVPPWSKPGREVHYHQHMKDVTTKAAEITKSFFFILGHLFLPLNTQDIIVILAQTVTYLQIWFRNKWGCPQQKKIFFFFLIWVIAFLGGWVNLHHVSE